MLIGIDPLLGPELLAILRAMGHGDELAIVDANFPAASTSKRHVRLDGADAVRTLEAILTLLPLDDFGPVAAWKMEDGSAGEAVLPVHGAFGRALEHARYPGVFGGLDRNGFYDRAAEAFAVVSTAETRLYGNILLRKGVVRPAQTADA